ncbi:hypothetical protein C8Q79DRAFT_737477 [Trametes meyenii]|nr:hypothetical protein C8Q79DRAFT_737477 [Trametes meyenii]
MLSGWRRLCPRRSTPPALCVGPRALAAGGTDSVTIPIANLTLRRIRIRTRLAIARQEPMYARPARYSHANTRCVNCDLRLTTADTPTVVRPWALASAGAPSVQLEFLEAPGPARTRALLRAGGASAANLRLLSCTTRLRPQVVSQTVGGAPINCDELELIATVYLDFAAWRGSVARVAIGRAPCPWPDDAGNDCFLWTYGRLFSRNAHARKCRLLQGAQYGLGPSRRFVFMSTAALTNTYYVCIDRGTKGPESAAEEPMGVRLRTGWPAMIGWGKARSHGPIRARGRAEGHARRCTCGC